MYQNQLPKATPLSGPDFLFISKTSALNSEVSNEAYFNVTQGTTGLINLTFTSMTNQPIEIPIDNLTLSSYSDIINPKVWSDTGHPALVQDNVFTYSYSFNKVIVQPRLSNSTVLTINFSDNAPVGQYTLHVNVGRAILINTHSESNSFTTIGLEFIVLPNQG